MNATKEEKLENKKIRIDFFDDILTTFIENLYKIVSQQIDYSIPEIEEDSEFMKNDFQLRFTQGHLFHLAVIPAKKSEKLLKSEQIFDYFLSTPVDIDYDKASESFAFLNILSSMALGLVKADLYLPEVIFETEDSFFVRYIPLINNNEIQKQIDKLKQIMPVNVCNYGNKFISKDGIIDLLAIFITLIVKKIGRKQNIPPRDKIIPIFAYDYPFKADNFAQKNIGQSISNWLEKLYVCKKDISPLVRIESFSGNDL